MKNLLGSILIFLLTFSQAYAQGGPPSGGGQSGDGNARPTRDTSSQELNLEGNRLRGNSKISGYVIDSTATIAVEYATIAMLDNDTKKILDGTMADEKGAFDFIRVAPGTYAFKITFIGYSELIVPNVKVIKGEDVDLGVIKLALSANMLNEVEVTGLKSLIEERVDRLVYNAENDITSKGGDGADVLRKVPMLTVDFDGNVSLRGNSNVRVLINNKPSTIVASSVADVLKMIPADLIKTVEVITSPSAKYDAEGSTGIINIITKKSTIQGYNLSVDVGAGLRGSNLGVNGNLKVGKFGFTLGGFGRSFYNNASTVLNQTTFGATENSITNQTSDSKDLGVFGRYSLGVDYEISENEYITGGVSFGTRNFNRDQDFSILQYRGDELLSDRNRTVDSKDLSNNVGVNLDYVKIYKPGQEWSVSTQYSQNNLTNNFDASIFDINNELPFLQRNLNDNVNREITFQTDYVTPIKKNQIFEVGAKRIMREVNSNFSYLVGQNGTYQLDLNNPSGLLNYNQNITAGYLSYTFSTKNKINFKTGVRYEHTEITGISNEAALSLPTYGNIVPSINISKTFNATTLKLAYNNRITRPGLQQLNPNFNASNPYSITIGNPNLRPEISNNVELSVSRSFGRNYINASFFGRQTTNAISQISTPSDTLFGAIISRYENAGTQKVAGVNLFGNFFITPKWSVNGGVDLFYNYLEGQVQTLDGYATVNNDGIAFNGRLSSQITLDNGWGIQGFAGFRGNNVVLQGTRTGTPMYSIGVRKETKDKKGTVGLAVENIFGGMQFQTTMDSPLFTQQNTNYIYNQNVKLTFSYKLGNMKFTENKKTRSVKNSDLKSDGEGSTM
jgi:outer membrane receptor protein involved in Fe transport